MKKEDEVVSRSQPCGEASADAEVFAGLTVETAAVRIGDAVFTLPRPNRHHNVMWWLHVLGIGPTLLHDQGFVLSNGAYADRQRAFAVAEAAAQIIAPPPVPGTLFSEDLWVGGADLPSVFDIKALTTPPATPAEAHVEEKASRNPSSPYIQSVLAQVEQARHVMRQMEGAVRFSNGGKGGGFLSGQVAENYRSVAVALEAASEAITTPPATARL